MCRPIAESLVPELVRKIVLRDEPRLAVFDADGVLWRGDIFEDFTRWLIAAGEIAGERWPAYEALARTDTVAACYDILRFYEGMQASRFAALGERFWQEEAARPWNEAVVCTLHWAKQQDFTVFVVSATAALLLQPAMEHLPIDRIVGLELAEDSEGRLTGNVAGVPTCGPGKAARIRSAWPHSVQLALGNSILDVEMLQLARDVAWAFEPDATLAKAAEDAGWLVTPRS